MHSKPPLTHAERGLVEAFARRVAEMPGNPAVAMQRDAAIESIKAGLPTRHIEAWHYTDLRRLLVAIPSHDASADPMLEAPLVEGSIVLPISNGAATSAISSAEGVTVRRVEEMLADGSYAGALAPLDADDAIGAINTAFVSDGYFVEIAGGTSLAAPLEIQNRHAGGQVHVRMPVRFGDGVRATIVERQSGTGEALVTAVSNVVVGDDSEVLWLIVQEQPTGVTHLGQFNAWIGENARLTLFVLNAGGALVRQEVHVATKGEGGVFTLRGVNLLSGDTHTDVTMVLDHEVPQTASTELVRNVVTGRARGVFQGRINVHQYAQKTDARMACNTLLLSDDAEFSTKPELEIFADDVQCGHGATVTEIDRNHLFYLMARGIDEKAARGLLVKAFVAEVIEELDREDIVQALEHILDGWFAEHG